MNREAQYDVFVSYSMSDAASARQVIRSLQAAELKIFDVAQLKSGKNIQDQVIQAIAESSAVVAIIGARSGPTPNMAVEIGAAWAWTKPVYVLAPDSVATSSLGILEGARIYPLSQVDDVIYAVKHGMQPLSEADRASLLRLYQQLKIPTDRLIADPAVISRMGKMFNRQRRKHVSGERLIQELIRMRKEGRLPRLRSAG